MNADHYYPNMTDLQREHDLHHTSEALLSSNLSNFLYMFPRPVYLCPQHFLAQLRFIGFFFTSTNCRTRRTLP